MKDPLLKIRHARSAKDYPHLGLQDGEFVELEFRRATICYVFIWILVAFASVLLTLALGVFNSVSTTVFGVSTDGGPHNFITLIGVILYVVFILAGLVTSRVFSGNRLYVTNQRAIQYEMISLFANSINIIELTKIEDVSFRQNGVFSHIFGTGTIRMSTIGDETTYTFKYAYKPTAGEIRSLTNLVSNAKKSDN